MENEQIDVLLVEDNSHDAELTIRALRKNNAGIKIIHLKNGAVVLDLLFGTGVYTGRNVNNKPKLILLDLKMPKVSGLEVLEKLTTDQLTKKIPVVVLTSSKENPDVERAYVLGANSYIVKPVDFESFQKIVSDLGMYWLSHNHPPLN
jgi:two-component system response regulator